MSLPPLSTCKDVRCKRVCNNLLLLYTNYACVSCRLAVQYSVTQGKFDGSLLVSGMNIILSYVTRSEISNKQKLINLWLRVFIGPKVSSSGISSKYPIKGNPYCLSSLTGKHDSNLGSLYVSTKITSLRTMTAAWLQSNIR